MEDNRLAAMTDEQLQQLAVSVLTEAARRGPLSDDLVALRWPLTDPPVGYFLSRKRLERATPADLARWAELAHLHDTIPAAELRAIARGE